VTEEIYDMSRFDSFMASRRRAMFFHSVWKPMLAGAVGAALMSGVALGIAWVALPKIAMHDVVVDHVVVHDVPFDNHVPQPKPFDLPVPQPKPFDLPAPAPKPVADAAPPTMGPDSPYAPKTPEERKFTQQPEYKTADYHGRIVKSKDGSALTFEDGQSFSPAHLDPSGTVINDPDKAYDSDQFIGDLGMCVKDKNDKLWTCTASHNGQTVDIVHKPRMNANAAPADNPTADLVAHSPKVADANGMINVDVVLEGYGKIVNAMVDTGCSFPLSITPSIADALLRNGAATQTRPMTTTLADGSSHDISVITIKSISVDGRVLDDVEAGVNESEKAPILLGLGALNRLGPYTIGDGRIVFTGEPA